MPYKLVELTTLMSLRSRFLPLHRWYYDFVSMESDSIETTPFRARRPTLQEERPNDREMLIQLGQALGRTAVPAAFWACVRVADILALECLVAQAQAALDICILLLDNCYVLPRLWMQKNINDEETTTASSESSNRSWSKLEKGKTAPPFWSLLQLFFDKQKIKINQWQSEIFRNPDQPDKGVLELGYGEVCLPACMVE